MAAISPQLRAWRKAYQIVAEANPWDHPDLALVIRMALFLLVEYMQQEQQGDEPQFGLAFDPDGAVRIVTPHETMQQELPSPLLGAWRKAYAMVAGANPWQRPDMALIARLARRILAADSRQAQREPAAQTGGPRKEA